MHTLETFYRDLQKSLPQAQPPAGYQSLPFKTILQWSKSKWYPQVPVSAFATSGKSNNFLMGKPRFLLPHSLHISPPPTVQWGTGQSPSRKEQRRHKNGLFSQMFSKYSKKFTFFRGVCWDTLSVALDLPTRHLKLSGVGTCPVSDL